MDKHDDPATMKKKYTDLGTMVVKLSRSTYKGIINSERNPDVPTLEAIPEKALKGRPLDVATTFEPRFRRTERC